MYDIYKAKFNFRFKAPWKDTCRTCDDLNLKIQGADDENAKKDYGFINEKQIQQEKCYRLFRKKNWRSMHTFDLQKA